MPIHNLAKRAKGFSVRLTVRDYEMRNRGTNAYHSRITKATLCELSLVEDPCNADCVILSREPYRDATAGYVKAAGAHLDAIAQKLQTLSKLAGALK